jgi:hypothetical protein
LFIAKHPNAIFKEDGNEITETEESEIEIGEFLEYF